MTYLVILDAVLGELVDVKPEGIAEVVDPLALLSLKELKRHRQNGPNIFKMRANLFYPDRFSSPSATSKTTILSEEQVVLVFCRKMWKLRVLQLIQRRNHPSMQPGISKMSVKLWKVCRTDVEGVARHTTTSGETKPAS